MRSLLFSILMAFSLFSCIRKKEDVAFKVFNDGVRLNLKAIEEQGKGNIEVAAAYNKKSIERFKETLKIDSAHEGARSALGHSLYVDKQFNEAIYWFEQANKVNGEMAINYREMGLCKINVGEVQAGIKDINKAFAMNPEPEMRQTTIQDLVDIGELAFEYGESFIAQGEAEKGKNYHYFTVEVLRLASDYDRTQKQNALKVAEYATKFGDKEMAEKYRLLGEK